MGSAQVGKARSLAGELTALTLAGFLTLLSFRVFQPYAFEGPTFFGVKPNALWLQNMREVQGQASGIVDAPFALQWANRPPVWFAFKNLVLYGLGWPLGLLAWIGWAWALGRMIKGDWERHLLPVVWTGGYFLWRSTGFTPAMRYLLPIYPTLALMAGWALWEAYVQGKVLPVRWRSSARISLTVVATFVLGYTAAYAVAFARNYSLPFTRYEASQWIFANYPGPTNLILQSPQGGRLEPMPLPEGFTLDPGQTYSQGFILGEPGTATAVIFPHVEDLSGVSEDLTLTVKLLASDQPGHALAETQFTGRLPPGENARIELRLPQAVELQEDVSYVLQFETTGSARLALRGAGVVSESSWDDGLPLRIEGRDGYGGLYRGFNLELYWPDDQDDNQNAQPDKLERIVDSLGAADYLAISSNRQYASIGRVPQRYPLTGEYFRALLGCPAPEEIERCVERAQPGNLQGELGYELVAVFQRDPSLGPFRWRDQLAEEAFT
ncbi:MAG TPA: hypothetical protein VJA25_08440, partial [Dehalococcoidia bacterium]|nr:hypothetical protein [Dehalococcoidia bacterium]